MGNNTSEHVYVEVDVTAYGDPESVELGSRGHRDIGGSHDCGLPREAHSSPKLDPPAGIEVAFNKDLGFSEDDKDELVRLLREAGFDPVTVRE